MSEVAGCYYLRVECDRCRRQEEAAEANQTAADCRKELKQRGWTWKGKNAYCKTCSIGRLT